jgi:hypothetical protein
VRSVLAFHSIGRIYQLPGTSGANLTGNHLKSLTNIPHNHQDAMPSSDQTINIPQLLIVLIISVFAIRYFFFPSTTSSGSQGRSANSNLRAREADVERVQQMFPQVSRRSIMWDLQRNGGNVVATTERILSGRGLEVVSLSLCAGSCEFPIFESDIYYELDTNTSDASRRSPSNRLFQCQHRRLRPSRQQPVNRNRRPRILSHDTISKQR